MTLPSIKIEAKADSKDAANVFNKLIGKISDAIGTIYEPRHLVRMADAQSQALIIAVETEAVIPEIQQRAINRLHRQETRKQINLEHTIGLAEDLLEPSAKPEQIDEDWLNEWIERAARVSDEELQSLWARILAGEANSPKSFRKSVLHTVSMLEKSDAEIFTNLCKFVVVSDEPIPLILDEKDDIYGSIGINYSTLGDLEVLGIIFYESSSNIAIYNLPQKFNLSYGKLKLNIELPSGQDEWIIGKVRLTQVGIQLFGLCDVISIPNFPQYITEHYSKQSIIVTGSSINSASKI